MWSIWFLANCARANAGQSSCNESPTIPKNSFHSIEHNQKSFPYIVHALIELFQLAIASGFVSKGKLTAWVLSCIVFHLISSNNRITSLSLVKTTKESIHVDRGRVSMLCHWENSEAFAQGSKAWIFRMFENTKVFEEFGVVQKHSTLVPQTNWRNSFRVWVFLLKALMKTSIKASQKAQKYPETSTTFCHCKLENSCCHNQTSTFKWTLLKFMIHLRLHVHWF
jgi:hypothetical protein